MTTAKLLLGALACVAAGAAIGILFAPDKGSETRRKIVKKGEDTLKYAEDTLKSAEEKVEDKLDEVRTRVSQTFKRQKPEGQPVNSA